MTKHRLDIEAIRAEFPILAQQVNGHPLVYLDNAATTQKPQVVLDAMDLYYRTTNSNIHRGVHELSQRATARYDAARVIVKNFLNAASEKEIIFTKGCTESINLVAACLPVRIGPGDTILLSAMEHHSNIVPWQLLAERTGASISVIPISDEGEIDLGAYAELLKQHRVKLVALVHVSNSLGTINPVTEMTEMAHEAGALVLLDGAQAVAHLPVNVQALDADFYVLSGHKLYGPTGVGVLYGKQALLETMPPYQGGGDMIRTVSFEKSTYAGLPAKFEAGTPNIAGVIGLGAAIEWLVGVGLSACAEHEDALATRATELLGEIPGVRLVGTAREKASIVSFVMEQAHPHDIGTILDSEGVAIRAGHHCCMPLMRRLGVPATARASFAAYNTTDEVEVFAGAVRKVAEVFA